jgi:hypothetical protein
VTGQLASAVLMDRESVKVMARRNHRSAATVRRHIRQAFRTVVTGPMSLSLPDGELVLVMDGLWAVLRGRRWVLYNMALKPAGSNTAWFLAPHLRAGHEGVRGWEEALETIPVELGKRIRAVVSDGIPGIAGLLQRHGWLSQLCHRHLLSALDIRLGPPRRQRVRQQPGRGIRTAILELLACGDDGRATALCDELLWLCSHPNCTAGLRSTVRNLVKHQQAYRTYLRYPELTLPITTNAVESMHGLLRKGISTANSPETLLLRAQTYLRLRQKITCNGAHFQQN